MVLRLIAQLINGVNFASYELDTLIYRAEPIKQRQHLIIPKLSKNQVIRVDLLGQLQYPLLVTGIDIDIVDDDENYMESGRGTSNSFYSSTRLNVTVINRKTKNIIKKIAFVLNSYPSYTNEIILNPNHIYDIKCERDINMITFTGEPVHLKNDIIFFDSVPQE